jgi:hypothetical protein
MLTIPPFLGMRRHQPVVRMLSEQKLARVHDVGERVIRYALLYLLNVSEDNEPSWTYRERMA